MRVLWTTGHMIQPSADMSASAGAQVSVRDGLAAVAAAAPGRYDAIVVDAGSGNAAAAMSCPPPAFLATEFLRQVRAGQAGAFITAEDADPHPHVRGSHVHKQPAFVVVICGAMPSVLLKT